MNDILWNLQEMHLALFFIKHPMASMAIIAVITCIGLGIGAIIGWAFVKIWYWIDNEIIHNRYDGEMKRKIIGIEPNNNG